MSSVSCSEVPLDDVESFHRLYYETEEGCDTEGTRPKGDTGLMGFHRHSRSRPGDFQLIAPLAHN